MERTEFEKLTNDLIYVGIPIQKHIYSVKYTVYGDLLPVQTLIIHTLFEKTTLCMAELAKYLGKTSQGISKPLQDLEKRNLIVRESSETNKKIINYKLTKEGIEIEKKATKLIYNNCYVKFSYLSDEDLEKLKSATTQMIEIFDKLNEI